MKFIKLLFTSFFIASQSFNSTRFDLPLEPGKIWIAKFSKDLRPVFEQVSQNDSIAENALDLDQIAGLFDKAIAYKDKDTSILCSETFAIVATIIFSVIFSIAKREINSIIRPCSIYNWNNLSLLLKSIIFLNPNLFVFKDSTNRFVDQSLATSVESDGSNLPKFYGSVALVLACMLLGTIILTTINSNSFYKRDSELAEKYIDQMLFLLVASTKEQVFRFKNPHNLIKTLNLLEKLEQSFGKKEFLSKTMDDLTKLSNWQGLNEFGRINQLLKPIDAKIFLKPTLAAILCSTILSALVVKLSKVGV